MPVAPKPFKFECPKCGYSKVVKPKSDVISLIDLNNICPKCNSKMDKKKLNAIDSIKGIFA